ncbi:DUF6320 domain-containing protein [Paraflavisolibacter sp. H34]|uniref:DUF6320 domain-containing protein n=1 Tax=Huijunlia imazamoxiresistens TaxID=3127457 RepID=UPI0030175C84
MVYCNRCGVELEEDMRHCPLCGEAASANPRVEQEHGTVPADPGIAPYGHGKMDRPQKRLTWEIISLILFSGITTSFIIDFAMNRHITWSEYPIAICLIIFSYVSCFAFWNQRTIVDIAAGFLLSSAFLLLIDALKDGMNWAIGLGIPLLFAVNLVLILLLAVFRAARYKGMNLIAYAFIAAAFLCTCIEGLLSLFKNGSFHLWWSLIVMACLFPVVLVLLFVHFRLRKGRSLHKTFHM